MVKMDSFGRLPNDILQNIGQIFSLPEIDIVQKCPDRNAQKFDFIIKYQSITTKIRMISDLVHTGERNVFNNNEKLSKFIDDLCNDIDCSYGRSYYDNYDYISDRFQITFIDDMIKINSKDTKIILSKDSKEQLIFALKKYHEILKKYI